MVPRSTGANQTYDVRKYRCKPHVSTISRVVDAINQFIRSPHITSDVT